MNISRNLKLYGAYILQRTRLERARRLDLPEERQACADAGRQGAAAGGSGIRALVYDDAVRFTVEDGRVALLRSSTSSGSGCSIRTGDGDAAISD